MTSFKKKSSLEVLKSWYLRKRIKKECLRACGPPSRMPVPGTGEKITEQHALRRTPRGEVAGVRIYPVYYFQRSSLCAPLTSLPKNETSRNSAATNSNSL